MEILVPKAESISDASKEHVAPQYPHFLDEEIRFSFCTACMGVLLGSGFQSLLNQTLPRHVETGVRHVISYQNLLANARQGCKFCSQTVKSINVGVAGFRDGEQAELCISITRQVELKDCLSVQVFRDDGDVKRGAKLGTWMGWILAQRGSMAADVVETLDVNSQVTSRRATEQATGWLEECLTGHPLCSPPTDQLPGRVIELSQKSIRLAVSSHTEKNFYAALSYVWGGDQRAKLTRERLDAYKHEIPFHQLPRTLKDAVAVTRSLRLKYLWVDALCIVQDDEDDKMCELAQMHNIFKNAYVTIAATATASAEDGFLHQRPDPETWLVPFTTSQGSEDLVRILPDRPGNVDYCRSVIDAPLDQRDFLETRAWALQERALATRTLVYAHSNIRWQRNSTYRFDGGNADLFRERRHLLYMRGTEPEICHERVVTSGASQVCHAKDLRPRERPGGKDPSPSKHALVSQDTPRASRIRWLDLIEDFTRRRIGSETEKLYAIAALAQEYSVLRHDVYLAGLWQNDLAMHLLWRVAEADFGKRCSPRARPAAYLAPTWSWAAVNLPVHFLVKHRSCFQQCQEFRIVEAATEPAKNSLAFGTVSAGHIIVDGILSHLDSDVLWGTSMPFFDLDTGWDSAPSFHEHLYLLRIGWTLLSPSSASDSNKSTSSNAGTERSHPPPGLPTCLILHAEIVEHESLGRVYRRVGLFHPFTLTTTNNDNKRCDVSLVLSKAVCCSQSFENARCPSQAGRQQICII